jgi:hypothetical protein
MLLDFGLKCEALIYTWCGWRYFCLPSERASERRWHCRWPVKLPQTLEVIRNSAISLWCCFDWVTSPKVVWAGQLSRGTTRFIYLLCQLRINYKGRIKLESCKEQRQPQAGGSGGHRSCPSTVHYYDCACMDQPKRVSILCTSLTRAAL